MDMTISKDTERVCEKMVLQGTYLNVIKNTANIILNGEKLNNPTKVRNETGISIMPTPFQYYVQSTSWNNRVRGD